MILGRLHRQNRLAVHKGQNRRLFAFEKLLDHDAVHRIAEDALLEDGGQLSVGLRAIGVNRDALALGEVVELDHDRQRAFGHVAARFVQ